MPVTSFFLRFQKLLEGFDSIPLASTQADTRDLAGCGHPPQLALANCQGFGSLLGGQ
jgi:hypothetical protein